MRRRKRDIVIELTALLDVIMILIFMVMNNNGKIINETQSEFDQAQQENAEQAGVIDDLNNQIADLSAQLDDALQQLDEEGLGGIWEQLQDAQNSLEGYESINEVAIILNVSLENKGTVRAPCLSFGNPADSTSNESHEWKDDANFSAAVNKLKVFISNYSNQLDLDDPNSPMVYILFSYDPNKIYLKDFEKIDSVLKDAEDQANSANFRYRCIPSSKEQ